MGSDAVRVEWAFTNAETGGCVRYSGAILIGMNKGAIWVTSRHSVDPATGKLAETRICDARAVTDSTSTRSCSSVPTRGSSSSIVRTE